MVFGFTMLETKYAIMKHLILSFFLVIGGLTLAHAQDDTQTPPASQDNREKIEIGQLPQPVRTALESEDYATWTVSAAYRSTQTESSDETKSMEVYVVEMKNGADTQIVKFDKDGNKVNEEIEDNQK